MQFGHGQLDVYRISIRYVTWAYQVAKSLKGSDRPTRDQLLRASQSIPLHIAEGNGQGTNADIGAASSRSLGARRWNAHRFRTVSKPAKDWLLLKTHRVRQCRLGSFRCSPSSDSKTMRCERIPALTTASITTTNRPVQLDSELFPRRKASQPNDEPTRRRRTGDLLPGRADVVYPFAGIKSQCTSTFSVFERSRLA